MVEHREHRSSIGRIAHARHDLATSIERVVTRIEQKHRQWRAPQLLQDSTQLRQRRRRQFYGPVGGGNRRASPRLRPGDLFGEHANIHWFLRALRARYTAWLCGLMASSL